MESVKKGSIKELKEVIENAKNVAIITHTNPDGDTVGAATAIAGLLKQNNTFLNIIIPNDCPDFLQWMPGYEYARVFFRQKNTCVSILEKADVVFCVDFNTTDRVDEVKPYLDKALGKKILIDHHPNPSDFADIIISDTHASSTSELLYEVLVALGYSDRITKEIASSIYCGIITDTGGLNHNSSNPRTYRTIAGLLGYDIDKDQIHQNIFQNHTADRMMLLGNCLYNNLVFYPEHKAACLYISLEDQKKYNFKPGDSEGFVNMPLAVKDVLFCVLFTEKENMVKASFRSKGDYPANEFSMKYFEGGGHFNAAGGKYMGALKEAIAYFESKLAEFNVIS